MLPVAYTDDRAEAEQILLAAAQKHAVVDDAVVAESLASMQARYAVSDVSLTPSAYWRITDNWLELSLRFLVPQRGVREIKDRMFRDILAGLDTAGIGIASSTYDVVGLPPISVTTNTPGTD